MINPGLIVENFYLNEKLILFTFIPSNFKKVLSIFCCEFVYGVWSVSFFPYTSLPQHSNPFLLKQIFM